MISMNESYCLWIYNKASPFPEPPAPPKIIDFLHLLFLVKLIKCGYLFFA